MPAPEGALERWFEDFHPGDVAEFGDHEMTEAEIVAFAASYDPQSFHTDPEAATCECLWRADRQRLAHRRR